MRIQEVRALADTDLYREAEETQRELFNLRLRLATQRAKNSHELREARRKLARIQTILRERNLSGDSVGSA
ncbi:MAG: 50S ribosomal protein L29 [Chloroflexi bacterium]|nr:50S ribosomal protein L29 [Chloroflexota bacterium]